MIAAHVVTCSPGHEPNACDATSFTMGQWSGKKDAPENAINLALYHVNGDVLFRSSTSAGRHVSHGETLVGTSYAFNLIYLHQHPTNCAAAKFLVWIPSHNGIGEVF